MAARHFSADRLRELPPENVVPFVLWFNFVAGFAYVAAGLGLYLWKRCAGQVSALIAAATMLVLVAFGLHVFLGGAFEMRTAGVMVLRSLVWLVIAAAACHRLGCFRSGALESV